MNDEGLLANGVSATKRGETIAGRSCFGNDGGEKNDGVKGKTDERLLVIGVSATGEKMKGCWCFSNGNSEKMAGVGRNEKC
jgi:hypothetical protein